MANVYYTEAGDTWDKIAYDQYGSEKFMQQLILANWDKLDVLVFSDGEEIILPDIPEDELDDTPVWRSDSDRDDGIPTADEDESEVE